MSEPTNEMVTGKGPVTEGWVERACRVICFLTFFAMIAIIGVEILARSTVGYSFQVADELSGYLLVCLAFFSLAVTQANDGFHRVEFVQSLLSDRGRILSRIAFDITTLAFALILLWVFWRLVGSSLRLGTTAPTYLRTPLWIPQMAMVLGAAAFAISLVRSIIINARTLRGGRLTASKDS